MEKLKGHGPVILKSGDRYEEEFHDDKREEYGEYFFCNGKVFKGVFSQDNFEGEGTMFYPDKSKMTGIYHNSTPISVHTKVFLDNKVEEVKFTG